MPQNRIPTLLSLGALALAACAIEETGGAPHGSGGAAGMGATPSTGGAPITGGGGSPTVGGGGTTGGTSGTGGLGATGGQAGAGGLGATGGQAGAGGSDGGPIDATTDAVSEADAPVDVASDAPLTTQLHQARIELPCAGALSSVACAAGVTSDVFAFEGTPGVTYSVTLRFRGVVEQTTYAGGTKDGYFYTGGTLAAAGWNTFSIKVGSPAQTYWLNAGTAGTLYCFSIDYTQTIKITGGATVTLNGDALDGQQVRNIDSANNPIVVPGIPPAPAAYDGQFVYIDVLSVVPS